LFLFISISPENDTLVSSNCGILTLLTDKRREGCKKITSRWL
jgi:hypothetical protein